MSASITTEKITLSYPLFSADFLDLNQLIVAGGGGEGRNGVGNKITLLDVSKSASKHTDTEINIKQLAEHVLSKDEDACMSLAVSRSSNIPTTTSDEYSSKSRNKKKATQATAAPSDVVFTGINSSEKSQLAGTNEHFRIFSVTSDSISPNSQHQLFTPSSSVENYQRVLRTRGSFAAIANGGGLVATSKFEIVVVNISDTSVRRRIETEVEVADLDLCDDGTLGYCTSKDIFITSATSKNEPRKLQWQSSPPIMGVLRTIRFLTPTRLAVVLNYPQRSGAEVLLLDTSSGDVLKRKKLHRGIKAVTGFDAAALAADGSSVIAVAGADQSVEILAIDTDRITSAGSHRDVHPFQITKVVFSPPPPAPASYQEGNVEQETPIIRLATTSMGNTVVVFTLPLLATRQGFRLLQTGSVAKQTAISVLLSLVLVVFFAILLQYVFFQRAGLHDLSDAVSEVNHNTHERHLYEDVLNTDRF
ncbi:hypothetical protein EDC01DRAFT_85371 [Geopyxis carbonaria]|nr:hypothetical protein EDC01DRAFT_85371 [Geopyxis carbonaria]